MIPDELIDRVREATDIVEIVGQRVQLKRTGANYKGLCPFHQEKTPSFTVHQGKQIYRCFGCGAGGNVFSFLMKSQGLTFVEAVRTLASRAGIALPEQGEDAAEAEAKSRHREKVLDVLEMAAGWFRRQLKESSEAKEARLYAGRRGITEASQEAFRLGWSPRDGQVLAKAVAAKGLDESLLIEAGLLSKDEGGRIYARFRGRLMFPILNAPGRVVGFGGRLLGDGEPKYLNSPETIVFQKGSLLYALPQARESILKRRQALLVEGYMDALACHQAGVPYAVATLGTALGELHAKALKRYADEVVLVYDSDNAGVAAARRGSEALLAAGLAVKVLSLKGAKDPDEFLKARGREAFELALKDALSAPAFFVLSSLAPLGGADKADPHARAGILQGLFPLLALYPTAVEADSHLRAAAQALNFPEQAAADDFQAWTARQKARGGQGTQRGAQRPPSGGPRPAVRATPVEDPGDEGAPLPDAPPEYMGGVEHDDGAPAARSGGAAMPVPVRPAAPAARAKPDALRIAERELLRLLVERPDLVAEAREAMPEPAFDDPHVGAAARLLLDHPGVAVMQMQMEEGVSEEAKNLLLDLALEPPQYPRGEEALPQILARIRLERLKRRKAEVDAALRQGGPVEALAAEGTALSLEIQQLKLRLARRG